MPDLTRLSNLVPNSVIRVTQLEIRALLDTPYCTGVAKRTGITQNQSLSIDCTGEITRLESPNWRHRCKVELKAYYSLDPPTYSSQTNNVTEDSPSRTCLQ